MSKKKIIIASIAVWMMVIFVMSNQPGNVSFDISGSFIEMLKNVPIVGSLLNDILVSNSAQFIIRKGAHMFSYLTLAVLCFMVIYEVKKSSKKATYISFLISFLYACSDEFHQLFIPGRGAQFKDVMIDCVGAFIGLMIVNAIVKISENKKSKVSADDL